MIVAAYVCGVLTALAGVALFLRWIYEMTGGDPAAASIDSLRARVRELEATQNNKRGPKAPCDGQEAIPLRKPPD